MKGGIISFKSLRRVTFSFYLVFALCFTIILYYMGSREIDKISRYTELRKEYSSLLLNSSDQISVVEEDLSKLTLYKSKSAALKMHESITLLREQISNIANISDPQISKEVIEGRLGSHILTVITCSSAYLDAIENETIDKDYIVKEISEVLLPSFKNIKIFVNERLMNELDLSNKVQGQFKFYYSRLQRFVLIFFSLTITFALVSSYLYSSILRANLKRVGEAAHEISRGNLEYRFSTISNDEIGRLMKDFNYMSIKLKRHQNEIEDANKELTVRSKQLIEANQHKDRFLANMSHELRTPLNSVIGFSELIMTRADKLSAEKLQSYGERILSASEHLLDLISGLLEVAKIDAGVLSANPEYINIKDDCIDYCVKIMNPVIVKKNLELEINATADMPIFGDKKMIRQILLNLLNNALKYTHEGKISIVSEVRPDEYIIRVTDTGIGIGEKDHKLIFNDFHRAEEGMTVNFEGVGIGLTLTKRLVELHGGTISLSSLLGKGSTFSIYLPVQGINKEKNE